MFRAFVGRAQELLAAIARRLRGCPRRSSDRAAALQFLDRCEESRRPVRLLKHAPGGFGALDLRRRCASTWHPRPRKASSAASQACADLIVEQRDCRPAGARRCAAAQPEWRIRGARERLRRWQRRANAGRPLCGPASTSSISAASATVRAITPRWMKLLKPSGTWLCGIRPSVGFRPTMPVAGRRQARAGARRRSRARAGPCRQRPRPRSRRSIRRACDPDSTGCA